MRIGEMWSREQGLKACRYYRTKVTALPLHGSDHNSSLWLEIDLDWVSACTSARGLLELTRNGNMLHKTGNMFPCLRNL